MLQQTRVAAVLEHYAEFLRRFPSIQELADARPSEVLAAWSGLGYYRRARALHQATREVARQGSGKFPVTVDEWLALPGIGRYTAAAIASITLNQAVAVVDGNVERVLGRLAGKRLIGEQVWTAAGILLSPKRPGDFNQAMMELGATVCTPRNPQCLVCPLMKSCVTRGELPASAKEPAQRKVAIHYGLVREGDQVLLVRRPKSASLMPGMWELPEIPEKRRPKTAAWLKLKHSITTTNYGVNVHRTKKMQGVGRWLSVTRLKQVPLTGLARKILRAAKFL